MRQAVPLPIAAMFVNGAQAQLGGGGPPPVTLYPVPFIFAAAGKANNAVLHGKPADNGSAYGPWVDADGLGGSTANHVVTLTSNRGIMSGGLGTLPANALVTVDVGVPAAGVETWVSNVIVAASKTAEATGWGNDVCDWGARGGGTATNIPRLRWTIISGVYRLASINNANAVVAGTVMQYQGGFLTDGDTVTRVYWNAAGTEYMRMFVNGRLVNVINATATTDFNLNATIAACAGLARTGQFGFQGSMASQGVRTITAGHETDAQFMLRWENKVMQRQADGSVRASFLCSWTAGAPGAANVTYTAYDRVSGTAIAGHTDVLWQDYSVDVPNQTVSGRSLSISAADAVNGLYFIVTRTDGSTGATSSSSSRYVEAGEVFITWSQSLGQQWASNSTATYTISNTRFTFTGNGTDQATAQQSRTTRIIGGPTAGSGIGKFAEEVCGASGYNTVHFLLGRGGTGGKTAYERLNGVEWARWVDCLQAVGNDVRRIIMVDGNYEAAGTLVNTPYANNDEAVDDYINVINAPVTGFIARVEALTGRTAKCMMLPVGANMPASAATVAQDATMERLRMIQAQMCVADPTRFVLGPMTTHLQHSSGDAYHLVPGATGYQTQGDLIRACELKAAGLASFDLNGPSIASVARTDARTITAVINLNGATNLAAINAVAANNFNYDGGVQFGDTISNSLGTRHYPNGVTVDTTTGGTQKNVVWTFAADLPASVIIRANYGYMPFGFAANGVYDRTNIGNNLANASILQGVYTGEQPVAIQPIRDSGATINYKVAT